VLESLPAGNGNVKTYSSPAVDTLAHDFGLSIIAHSILYYFISVRGGV
jgi:hypothetical protein